MGGNSKYPAIFISYHPSIIYFLEKWHGHGNAIQAVICDDQTVRQWLEGEPLKDENIPVFPESVLQSPSVFSETLNLEPSNNPDYIFSIMNHHILDLVICDLAKIATINFHEGPLNDKDVRYRGVYAASWMLYQRAKQFAITWHEVDKHIDTGQVILQSQSVEICTGHDGISLPIAGLELAKSSFVDLIKQLGTEHSIPQASDEQARKHPDRLYLRRDKLPSNGLIHFAARVNNIIDIHRALTLPSSVPNYFGTSKLLVASEGKPYDAVLFPRTILATDNPDNKAPATLLEIQADSITVAVLDGAVQLKDFYDINARPIKDMHAYCGAIGIKKGDCLPLLTQDARDFLTSFSPEDEKRLPKARRYQHHLYTQEAFWEKTLARCVTTHFNFTLCPQVEKGELTTLNLSAPLLAPERLLAVVVAYCYRFNPVKQMTVGYWDERRYAGLPDVSHPFFLPVWPVNFEFSAELGHHFNRFVDEIRSQLQSFDGKSVFSSDLLHRYPKLAEKLRFPFPITVVIADEITPSIEQLARHSMLTWVFHSNGLTVLSNPGAVVKDEREIFEYFVKAHLATKTQELLALVSTAQDVIDLTPWWHVENHYPAAVEDASLEPCTLLSNAVDGESVALVGEASAPMTYAQLSHFSTSIREDLELKLGHQSREKILIYLPFGKAWIASVCGILAAGHAYVPLNLSLGFDGQDTASHEVAYLGHVLNKTNARLIMTDEDHRETLESLIAQLNLPGAQRPPERCNITPHMTEDHTDNAAAALCDITIEADDKRSAYVLFTSGTTGQAKGVDVSRKAIGFSTQARRAYYQEKAKPTCILALTDAAFDVTTGIVWWALSCGASLVYIDPNRRTDAAHIMELIAQHRVSHLIATPQQYQQCLGYIAQNAAEDFALTAVILGGEAWPADLLMTHETLLPATNVFNEYGPTECAVVSSVSEVYDGKTPCSTEVIPIGQPLTKAVEFRVEDEKGELVVPGIKGELYIGGPLVANGYCDEPEKTATAFVARGDTRFYKTSDSVYWDPTLEQFVFNARLGRELKYNGRRFDPQTILDCVESLDLFSQCFLEMSANKQLLLLLIPKDGIANSQRVTKKVMRELSTILAPGMMPLIVVCTVSTLPLTRNGKTDINKLAAEESERLSTYRTQLIDFWSAFYVTECHKQEPPALQAQMQAELSEQFAQDNAEVTTMGLDSQLRRKAASQLAVKFNLPVNFAGQITAPESLEQQAKMYEYFASPSVIVITGATGFLGSYLLHHLYREKNALLYVVVSSNATIAQKRQAIAEQLTSYGYDTRFLEEKAGHVKFIVGDISQKNWGLSKASLAELSGLDIVEVYHCAAVVNHKMSYDALKPANVDSVHSLVELAKAWDYPEVFYISTLSTRTHTKKELGGYGQVKLHAEALLQAARAEDEKLNVHIIRPGWISGESVQGQFGSQQHQQTDHFFSLLKAFMHLKAVPQLETDDNSNATYLYFIPIDTLCHILINLSGHTDLALGQAQKSTLTKNQDMNVAYPLKWSELVDIIKEVAETDLESPFEVLPHLSALTAPLQKAFDAVNVRRFPLKQFSDMYTPQQAGLLSALLTQKPLASTIKSELSRIQGQLPLLALRDVSLKSSFRNYVRLAAKNDLVVLEDLVQILQTEYKKQSDVPFLLEPEKTVELDNVVVDLELVLKNNKVKQVTDKDAHDDMPAFKRQEFLEHGRGSHTDKAPITLKGLYKPFVKNPTPNRIILQGGAGIGKSTLCKVIAQQWAKGEFANERFKLVLLLSLRQVVANFPGTGKYNIEEILLGSWEDISCPNAVDNYGKSIITPEAKQALWEYYQFNRGKVLFLLDGFDEVSAEHPAIAVLLKHIPCYILTSRTCGQLQTAKPLEDENIRHVICEGFSIDKRKEYIKRYFEVMYPNDNNKGGKAETEDDQAPRSSSQAQAKAQGLIAWLEANPNLHGLSRIPINCQLLCSVYDKEPQSLIAPMTMTQLYDRIMHQWQRRALQNRFSYRASQLQSDKVISALYQDALCVLRAIAFESLENRQRGGVLISGELLEKHIMALLEAKQVTGDAFQAAEEKLRNHILGLGVLKAIGKESNAYKDTYDFTHLTFIEYLAAEYLAKGFKHSLSHPRHQQAKQTLDYYQDHPRYEVVWWFVAGKLGQSIKDSGSDLTHVSVQGSKQTAALIQFFDYLLVGKTLTTSERTDDAEGVDKITQGQQQQLQQLMRCFDESNRFDAYGEEFNTHLSAWLANFIEYWIERDRNYRSDVNTIELNRLLTTLGMSSVWLQHLIQQGWQAGLISRLISSMEGRPILYPGYSYTKAYEEFVSLSPYLGLNGRKELLDFLGSELDEKDSEVSERVTKALVAIAKPYPQTELSILLGWMHVRLSGDDRWNCLAALKMLEVVARRCSTAEFKALLEPVCMKLDVTDAEVSKAAFSTLKVVAECYPQTDLNVLLDRLAPLLAPPDGNACLSTFEVLKVVAKRCSDTQLKSILAWLPPWLHCDDTALRLATMRILKIIVEGYPESELNLFLALLLPYLTDSYGDFRRGANEALTMVVKRYPAMQLNVLLDWLKLRLTNDDKHIRFSGIIALLKLSQRYSTMELSSLLPLVEEKLKDDDDYIRWNAALTLKVIAKRTSETGLKSILALLEALLTDARSNIRLIGMQVLTIVAKRGSEIEFQAALALFRTLLTNGKQHDRSEARKALVSIKERYLELGLKPFLEWVCLWLTDSDDYIRMNAMMVLTIIVKHNFEIKLKVLFELLCPRLIDSNQAIRASARQVLAFFVERCLEADLKEIVVILQSLLSPEHSESVQIAVIKAFNSVAECYPVTDLKELIAIMQSLLNPENSESVQVAAIEVLSSVIEHCSETDLKKLVAIMQSLLSPENSELVQTAVIAALNSVVKRYPKTELMAIVENLLPWWQSEKTKAVQVAVLKVLNSVVEHCPETDFKKLIAIMQSLLSPEHSEAVQVAVIKALNSIVKRDPGTELKTIVETLLSYLERRETHVRSTVLMTFKTIIKCYPETTLKMFVDMLFPRLNVGEEHVANAARGVLATYCTGRNTMDEGRKAFIAMTHPWIIANYRSFNLTTIELLPQIAKYYPKSELPSLAALVQLLIHSPLSISEWRTCTIATSTIAVIAEREPEVGLKMLLKQLVYPELVSTKPRHWRNNSRIAKRALNEITESKRNLFVRVISELLRTPDGEFDMKLLLAASHPSVVAASRRENTAVSREAIKLMQFCYPYLLLEDRREIRTQLFGQDASTHEHTDWYHRALVESLPVVNNELTEVVAAVVELPDSNARISAPTNTASSIEKYISVLKPHAQISRNKMEISIRLDTEDDRLVELLINFGDYLIENNSTIEDYDIVKIDGNTALQIQMSKARFATKFERELVASGMRKQALRVAGDIRGPGFASARAGEIHPQIAESAVGTVMSQQP